MKVYTIYDKMNPAMVEWTTDHNGKMDGMVSLSTSPISNEHCQRRHAKGESVCSKCFAIRQTQYRVNLAEKLERNTMALTEDVIPVEKWPIVPNRIARFESFGELNNITQLQNYFNCCKANPETTFALWTKNIFILKEAADAGIEKPDNMIIIQSSVFLNQQVKPLHKWVDKVFTVYTSEYIEKHGQPINCEDKCILCKRCYTKHNYIDYINEKLK